MAEMYSKSQALTALALLPKLTGSDFPNALITNLCNPDPGLKRGTKVESGQKDLTCILACQHTKDERKDRCGYAHKQNREIWRTVPLQVG